MTKVQLHTLNKGMFSVRFVFHEKFPTVGSWQLTVTCVLHYNGRLLQIAYIKDHLFNSQDNRLQHTRTETLQNQIKKIQHNNKACISL